MKSTHVYVIFNIFVSNFNVFSCENALISSDEPVNFNILSEQSVNNVVASRTLPSVEAHSDSSYCRHVFLWVIMRFECQNLMSSFR